MGTSWYSEGELVSREPEVRKSLIEEIVENEDVTTRICDLEIRGNSFFSILRVMGAMGLILKMKTQPSFLSNFLKDMTKH